MSSKVRYFIWLLIVAWASAAVVVVRASDSGTNRPHDVIRFTNFDHDVTLREVEGPGLFRFYTVQTDGPGAGQTVALDNRLVVKASTRVSKAQLQTLDARIVKVTELYSSLSSRYFSLETAPHQLPSVLLALQSESDIDLVQPDILQVSDSLEKRSLATSNKLSPYLSTMGIPTLWKQTRGAGVRVAIVDDGFDLDHPDLRHVTPVFAYDSQVQQLASSPVAAMDGHGTKVAGIIFAAHNQIGIDGIAPEAELIALRQPDTWTSNTLVSFQLARLAGADVINCSWVSGWLLQPVAEVVEDLAANGRDGRGLAVVFAAGNSGREIAQQSTEAAIEGAIVVGAGDEFGEPLAFSSFGSSVDLFNYGKPSLSTARGSGYARFDGSSLAAAITSGYISLLIAADGDITLAEILSTMQNH